MKNEATAGRANRGKLATGANQIIPCRDCGRNFQSQTNMDGMSRQGGKLTGMCPGCWEACGLENEHSDNDGKHYGFEGAHPNCPSCKAEAARAVAAPAS
jgi:transposase-like protein